ncbi:MAG: NfeD family protein [Pseudomonadota bacterium]
MIGTVLLVAELLAIDAAFYLVFLGVAAVATGVIVFASVVSLSLWVQWLMFAALALASMAVLRERLYRHWRPEPPGFEDTGEGEHVKVTQAMAPGHDGRAEWRGSTWKVRNDGDHPISAGSQARIVAREGTVLGVVARDADRREDPAAKKCCWP